MSAARPEPQPLLLPAEAAVRLRCSEWWLKDRARKGHIPYTFVGGAYKFSEEHIAEIIRIFQHEPTDTPAPAAIPQQRSEPRATTAPVIELKARTPRRVRTNAEAQAA